MITAVELVVAIVGVVLMVLVGVAGPYLRRRAAESGLEVRRRLTGSTEPSRTGTYVAAALFGAFGIYLLVVGSADETRGLPGWLSGAVLVVVGVLLAVMAPRRR